MIESKYIRWAGYALLGAGGSILPVQPVLSICLAVAGALLTLVDHKEFAN